MKTIMRISFMLAVAAIGFSNANSISSDEEQCPLVCPALYAPVCASLGKNFKEFDNSCELRAANCRKERDNLTRKSTLLREGL